MPVPVKSFFILIAFSAIFLFFLTTSWAAMNFTLDGIKDDLTAIDSDQEIEISFSFNNVSGDKSYYLQAAFKAKDGTRYFGWTQNERGGWYQYDEGDFTNFYLIRIEDGSKSASLKAKPDNQSSYFKGSGEYILKLFRFTEGGSKTASDNQVELAIREPTTTPTFTPTPEPEEESEEESVSPTATSTSSPTPTPTPRAVEVIGATLSGEVLGKEEASQQALYPWEATEGAEEEEATSAKKSISPLIFLGLGFVFLSAAAYRLWYTFYRKGMTKDETKEKSKIVD